MLPVVTHNAMAGHRFASWPTMEAHLDEWMREVADRRIHGTTGESPAERFHRDEAKALRALDGRPSFQQVRELVRVVHNDGSVEVDTNHYSVPWRLVGTSVTVRVSHGQLQVFHAGAEVARHPEHHGRRERMPDRRHIAGLVGGPTLPSPTPSPGLLRPLMEYERPVGGGW